jgi:hypothetical protein
MLTHGELDRNLLKHDGAFGMVEHGVKTEHTSELTAVNCGCATTVHLCSCRHQLNEGKFYQQEASCRHTF